MTLTARELADELLDSYLRRCGQPSRSLDHYVTRGDAPQDWKEACALAGEYGRTLHDLLSTSKRAGAPPMPITPLSIKAACDHLSENGMESKIRRACWMTAIRALPGDRPDLVEPVLTEPAAAIRLLNAPPGTFPYVESGLEAWSARACAPLTTAFEARERLSPGTANGISRHLLCAATALHGRGEIASDARLEQLLSAAAFDAWLQGRGDNSPASLLSAIDAFIRVRTDVLGDDETVLHMRDQTVGRRDHNKLPAQALAEVCMMLGERRRLEIAPFALMILAGCGDLPDRVRLKLANIAPAMNLAIDYALAPGDVFEAEHDPAFAFHPPVRLRKAACAAPPRRPAQESLLRQRQAVREALRASPAPRLMTSATGDAKDNKTCAQALDRTQRQFALIAHPWQRFRDFAAARLLIDAPKDIKRVADLLQVKNPALVELRYREVLPRFQAIREGAA